MTPFSQTGQHNEVQRMLETFFKASDEKSALSALEILIKDFAAPNNQGCYPTKVRGQLGHCCQKGCRGI